VLFSRGPFYIWHMPHFLFCIGRKTWRRPCPTSARRIAARIEVLINFHDQRPVCCYAKIKSATQSRNQLGLSITDLMARQFDDSAIPAPLLASQDSGSFRKIEFGLICRMHADRGSLLLWSSFLCLILLYLHIRVHVQSMTSQLIHVKPFFPLHEPSAHAQLACIRGIYKQG
jgi:hypothetical protein